MPAPLTLREIFELKPKLLEDTVRGMTAKRKNLSKPEFINASCDYNSLLNHPLYQYISIHILDKSVMALHIPLLNVLF